MGLSPRKPGRDSLIRSHLTCPPDGVHSKPRAVRSGWVGTPRKGPPGPREDLARAAQCPGYEGQPTGSDTRREPKTPYQGGPRVLLIQCERLPPPRDSPPRI